MDTVDTVDRVILLNLSFLLIKKMRLYQFTLSTLSQRGTTLSTPVHILSRAKRVKWLLWEFVAYRGFLENFAMGNLFGAMYPIAQTFHSLGYAVIPCDYRHKEASVKWAVYQVCRPSQQEVNRSFAHRITNAGILTGCHGWGAPLVVIDFDNLIDYSMWTRWAVDHCPLALEAYQVRTRRGMHVYLTSTNAVSMRNLHYGGVDVKAAGGYVMLPGSVHPSGFVYEAVDPDNLFFPNFDTLDQVLPSEILNRYTEPAAFVPGDQPTFKPLSLSMLDVPAGSRRSLKVKDVKQSHRIEEFIPIVEVTGKNWYLGHCPFHSDKNPSFWVRADTQFCGCYAGCNGKEPWDVINLYAKLHNLSNGEALRELSNI